MSTAMTNGTARSEILRRDIVPFVFPEQPPGGTPSLVLVAGQPGAGRARAVSALVRDGGEDLAVLTTEDLRAFLPPSPTQPASDEEPEALSGRDLTGWMASSIRYARENRRSLLLDGTFGDVGAAEGLVGRFATEGFSSRVVVVGSRRAESLLSVTSDYLRSIQARRPTALMTREIHDEGFAATRALVASLEQSAWADRLTVAARDGGVVFDEVRSVGADRFEGASAALVAAQSVRMSRFDATQWLSELHHATEFAAARRRLPVEVIELLVDLHEVSLREVIPELHVPATAKFATAIEQKTVAKLVALRQSLPQPQHIDLAAPTARPAEPDRGGMSR